MFMQAFMRPFVIYSFYSGGLLSQCVPGCSSYVTKNPFMLRSIGERNCGLAGGIFLFKLVVNVAWFICEACEKCMRTSPKTIYEKNGKKTKNYCAEGVWSVTLSSAFTKQMVFEYFYPSFMIVPMWLVDQ